MSMIFAKKTGAFNLFGKEKRESFFDQINTTISQMEFTLISRVIDKLEINKQNIKDLHIYHLSMKLALEELYSFLQEKGQANRLTHLVCEARGTTEDRSLEIEFAKICNGDNIYEKKLPFQIIIAHKQTNSEGLQLADLAARPVGLSIVYPDQSNRAMKILSRKIYQYQGLDRAIIGNIVYPPKSEKPQGTP
ncbi:MAG: DUF3800 domain-containing protein [Chlamydiales bacterium]|nr:DUF3800 domain-containing protein [Chlamydiales bacterium]